MMTDIENIDGYVSKDSLYRLLSNYRMTHVLTEKERSIVHDIIVAIKDMPNEKGEDLVAKVDELETEVFSLRNQNKLWECIVADYKKREEEFIKEKMEEEKKND